MTKKGVLAGFGLFATLGLGVWWGAGQLEKITADLIAQRLAAGLPGVTIAYDRLQVSLWRQTVAVEGLHAQAELSPYQKVEARTVRTAIKVRFDWQSRTVRVAGLDIDGLKATGPLQLEASHLQVTDPNYTDFSGPHFDPAKLTFANAKANGFSLQRANMMITGTEFTAGELADQQLTELKGTGVTLAHDEMTLKAAAVSLSTVRLPLLLENVGNSLSDLLSWSASVRNAELNGFEILDEDGTLLSGEKLAYNGPVRDPATAQTLSLVSQGLQVHVRKSTHPLIQVLDVLGYDQVAPSFGFTATIDPASDALKVSALSLDVPEVLSLNFQADVRGVSKLWLSQSAQSVFATLTGARLANMKIVLRDHGLLQRYIKRQADLLQIEPAVYVEMRIQALRPAAGSGGTGARRVGQIYRAISSFMLNPGELTLTAAPAHPLTLPEMLVGFRGLPDFLERLDITAVNRQISAQN